MITGMMEEMGLFLGKGKESGNNREHPFFVKINEWMLAQSNGSWTDPEPIRALVAHADLRALVADYLGFYLQTSRAISFLGWIGFLQYGTPAALDKPWGWKDPRNTYTLPVWLDLFPDARVVHIVRHGVDVANSIKVRADKGMERTMEELPARSKTKYRTLYYRLFEPKLWGFATALQDGSLEFGLDLWEKYVSEAHDHVLELGSSALEFRYEDFLLEPGPVLKRLADFAGLSVTDSTIGRLAERVRKDRAFAYRKHPHLTAFAEKMSDRLKVWGY